MNTMTHSGKFVVALHKGIGKQNGVIIRENRYKSTFC